MKDVDNIARSEFNERNDCAVIALVELSGASYTEAHKACRRRGRKDNKGMSAGGAYGVHSDLGATLVQVPSDELFKTNGRRITNNLASVIRPLGKFLIFNKNHVFAMIDGKSDDWSKSRRFEVKAMYEVVV